MTWPFLGSLYSGNVVKKNNMTVCEDKSNNPFREEYTYEYDSNGFATKMYVDDGILRATFTYQ